MKRTHSAFTLIELLAATVAMSILILAILNIIALMSKDRERESADKSAMPNAVIRLFNEMRKDCIAASSMTLQTSNRPFTLEGLCGLDSESCSRDTRRASVSYQLRKSDGESFLVRHQALKLIENQVKITERIALFNVSALVIEPEHTQPKKTGEPPPPPRYCQVVLTLNSGQKYTQTLVLQ